MERALSREVADALSSQSVQESLVELAGEPAQKTVRPHRLPNGLELTMDNLTSYFVAKAANMLPSFWKLELENYVGDLESDHQKSLVLEAKTHGRLNDHVKSLNLSAASNPDEDDWKWGCCEETCVEELVDFVKWLVLVPVAEDSEDPNQPVQKVMGEDMNKKIEVSNKKDVDETLEEKPKEHIPEEKVQEKYDSKTEDTNEQKDLKVEVKDQKNVEEHPKKVAMMEILVFKMHMQVLGRIDFEDQPTEETKQCQEFQDWLPKERSYANALGAYCTQITNDPMFAEFKASVVEKHGLADDEWNFNGPDSDPECDIRDWYTFLLGDPKRKDTLLTQLPMMIEIARSHPLFDIGFVKQCGIDPQSFGKSPDADYARFDTWIVNWNKEGDEETNLQEDQDEENKDESEDQKEENIDGAHHKYPKPSHEHAPDINILLESAVEVRYQMVSV